MSYIGYIFLRLVVAFFWLIPFPLVYKLSNGLAFLLYKVFGYRKRIVESNLHRCFPEKSEAEIKFLAWKSYINLSDIILEVIKSLSMPLEALKKRYKFKNVESINRHLNAGQSVIICGSHYNNWEWGVQTVGNFFTAPSYGVYKPLSNKYINDFFNKKRIRGGLQLLHMKDALTFIRDQRGIPEVYIFIADQSPSSRKRIQWIQFFGQETACASGTDFLARTYNYPVYHFQISRMQRGRYEVSFTEVCLDPSTTQESEITTAFMANLEKAIRQQPANWLWSHKRWKFTREDVDRELSEKAAPASKA